MAVNTKLMTADELFRLPDDGNRHELVRGELRTMPPGGMEQGERSSVLDGSLGLHVRTHRLGRVFTNEPGFVLETNPDTVRAPDIAFIRRERIDQTGVPRGYYRGGAPDLAVEVISPNDLYTEVDEKVAEWLEHGTLVVFVVNPRRRVVAVHRPGRPVDILGMDDTLTAEDVVPGWSLAVRDLFYEP
ncbi:MAG: Uma2 family endonuclease [Chloroflexota bacterium]